MPIHTLKLTRLMVKAHDDVVSDRITAVHLETHVSMQWPYKCTLACSVQVQQYIGTSFEPVHVNLPLLLRSILLFCVGGFFAFSVVRKLAKGPGGSVPVQYLETKSRWGILRLKLPLDLDRLVSACSKVYSCTKEIPKKLQRLSTP